jgi:hypothetical protein
MFLKTLGSQTKARTLMLQRSTRNQINLKGKEVRHLLQIRDNEQTIEVVDLVQEAVADREVRLLEVHQEEA